MQCRTVLTRVDALRTGELGAAEVEAVNEHLARCRSCDDSVHDVTSLAAAVKALAEKPPRSCRDSIDCSDSLDRIDDVWVAFNDHGIRMITRGSSESAFREKYAKRYGRALEKTAISDDLRRQVAAALTGDTTGKLRVDFGDEASDLERDVLSTLTRIPRGEVRTYSWLAEQVGRPRAVRAVASVVARNCVPFLVPCHRVVPASGGIGKYAFGSALKRELLRREGVDVEQLEALERKHVRYIGSKTTKIVCFPTCKDARRIREDNRVPFHDAGEAMKKGFRPCRRCQPFAA